MDQLRQRLLDFLESLRKSLRFCEPSQPLLVAGGYDKASHERRPTCQLAGSSRTPLLEDVDVAQLALKRPDVLLGIEDEGRLCVRTQLFSCERVIGM